MGGTLCAVLRYGGTKLANSLVRLVVAELGMLLSGSTSGGLITINVSGLGGKVLIAEGAWLGVKPFGMPYGGFSNGSCGAKELEACGLLNTIWIRGCAQCLKKSLNHLLARTSIDLSYVCYDH
jgi:hypothetical protein